MVSHDDRFVEYRGYFNKKDLKQVLNHVFNHLIICGKDFDKSPEFHKKKIIKDLNYTNKFSFKNFDKSPEFRKKKIIIIKDSDYSNMFSFKNFGFGIFFECEEQSYNKEHMEINIAITEFSPFLFLTKKEKIDFNNFLKFFKKFNNSILGQPFFSEIMEPIFEYKNNDFLLNLDDDISRADYSYKIVKKSQKLYEDFFNTTLYFKCDEKELEKFFQNFFKDFKILLAYNFRTFEKIRIPKRFLKSSMRINFKFNKLPMYVEFYRCSKEDEFKNLETYFEIEFGFLFERDIREANEDRKKLFNKYFKELKKLSDGIEFRQEEYCEDYFKKTLFDESGFRIGGLKKN